MIFFIFAGTPLAWGVGGCHFGTTETDMNRQGSLPKHENWMRKFEHNRPRPYLCSFWERRGPLSSRNSPGLADAITLLRGLNAGPSGRMNSGGALHENRIETATGAPFRGGGRSS